MVEDFGCNIWIRLYYTFSYTTLLTLQYGDRMQRTQAAWDLAEEKDISVRGGRAPNRHWALSRRVSWVVVGHPTPNCHTAWNVLTCHWKRAERGRVNGLPWPLGQCVWPICHGISRISYIQKGNERCLPECLLVCEEPQVFPLWSSTQEKGHSRYTFFSVRLTA